MKKIRDTPARAVLPSMQNKTVLVSHPHFGPYGGAEMVAAWTMKALSGEYKVVLACQSVPDWAGADALFGTDFSSNPPEVIRQPAWHHRLASLYPGKGRRFRKFLYYAFIRSLARRMKEALVFSTMNELACPGRGLQYVHGIDPVIESSPPSWDVARRWVYRLDHALTLGRIPSAAHNRTLVNSQWTGEIWTRHHGTPFAVVYPPVAPMAKGLAWAERENRVVCLGRWWEFKRLEVALEVVDEVRKRSGVPLKLSLIGFWDCAPDYRKKLEQRAGECEWVDWHERLGRAEIEALIGRSRYGLHCMIDEPFGIAVAELSTAGCIVFAHDSAGPKEILERPELLFSDAEEAVRRMCAVIASETWQGELHRAARPTGLRFEVKAFCETIRRQVEISFSGNNLD